MQHIKVVYERWIVIDNMDISTDIIDRGKKGIDITVENGDIWELIKLQSND